MATGSVAAFQLPLIVVPAKVDKLQLDDAVNEPLPPLQMVTAVVVGAAGFTVTVTVAVFTQPVDVFVPLTVYVVVEVGDNVAVLPVGVPLDTAVPEGDQLYVSKLFLVAGVTFTTPLFPLQIVNVAESSANAGGAVTVAVTSVRALSQPVENFQL